MSTTTAVAVQDKKPSALAAMASRVCRGCCVEKSPEEYYSDSRYPNGDIYCAACRREKVRQWRNSNPDRAKEIQRLSRERNPEAARIRARTWHANNKERHKQTTAKYRRECADKIRSSKLSSAFGITLDQYNEMLKAQSGVCAICGSSQQIGKRRMAVDHCHSTGKVRGLLCLNCNQGLGRFSDSVKKLESAIQYLKNNQ